MRATGGEMEGPLWKSAELWQCCGSLSLSLHSPVLATQLQNSCLTRHVSVVRILTACLYVNRQFYTFSLNSLFVCLLVSCDGKINQRLLLFMWLSCCIHVVFSVSYKIMLCASFKCISDFITWVVLVRIRVIPCTICWLRQVFLPALQFPLSVSFHHCSILIHPSTTHTL